MDGTTYNYNKTMTKDRLVTENVDNNVVAYLDANGYVIYIDESAVSYDYAYVLSMGSEDDRYSPTGSNETWYARLVLTDGTMIKVETDEDDGSLVGHIVSYSADKSDVYSLTAKDNDSEKDKTTGLGGTEENQNDADKLEIKNGVANITTNGRDFTANSNTVFIVAESDTDADKYDDYDFTVYTGVKNVPDIEGDTGAKVAVAADEDEVAKVVYVQDAEVSGTGEVIFIRAADDAKFVGETDSSKYWEIEAVVNGEVTTLKVKENSDAADMLVELVDEDGNAIDDSYIVANVSTSSADRYIVATKSITENSDGLVTGIKLYDKYSDGDGVARASTTGKTENETVKLGSSRYAWDDEVVVARYNMDSAEFDVSSIGSIKDDYNDEVLFVRDSKVLTGVCVIEYKGSGEDESDGNANVDDSVKSVELTKNGVAILTLNGFTDEATDYDYTLYSGDQIVQEGTITVKSGKSTASLVIEDLTEKTSYRLEIGGVSSKVVLYNGADTDGTVDLASVTEPQADSRNELKLMFSNLDQEDWGKWADLPTVGLKQTVSGSTIKLSGELDAINDENYADYKDAIEQWLSGTAADFAAFKSALTAQGYDMEDVTEVGFAALVVDGQVAVTCVVNDNGTVRALKSSDATFKWTPSKNVGEITVDVSGLSF